MTTEDSLDSPDHSPEVVLELSDGQYRWCIFVTPEMLSTFGGQRRFGDERLVLFGVPHMIVVSAITPETVARSLAHIESQGEIVDCTRPCSEEDDDPAT